MRMAHAAWLLVALGSEQPSEDIFRNECFPVGSCVPQTSSAFIFHPCWVLLAAGEELGTCLTP